MSLNKAALLAALKPKTELLEVEGFGAVGIIQLTVAEVTAVRDGLDKDGQADQFGLRLVLLSVVDAEGARIFDEADLADLQAASNAAMDLLVTKALEVNGFKKAAAAKN